ncbi:type II toxin-antitoxin system HicB family antitoxin [Sulfurimonas sp.]|jgi:predicted RNase H-like HicB family nuclease|uniref:type II toxin-antitoxin system HicB family antitoxin n=1 Tax=Sulfurimonas sp. TaxID=2022749 RepID=UPI0025F4C27E|nr:type II toxin-antitoxin system HicB family antitoxin [Sulfurimonas sp.]MCK9473605.1 type II toxin-antitoxin system HicB family antitoxin [Sulfurimonas sp.]MDD3505464.1 type II toxin-antitoxin system HicB family antitoxin [Sulfurimonas sp.]
MKYSVIIEEDKLDGGYIAYVPSLKGCYTQADTLDELKTNIIEAIEVSKEENEPVNTLFGIWELEVDNAAVASH